MVIRFWIITGLCVAAGPRHLLRRVGRRHMTDPAALGRRDSWAGVRAVVAGFGAAGFAAADNLLHLGATVTALDETAEGREDQAEPARGPRGDDPARHRRDRRLCRATPTWSSSRPAGRTRRSCGPPASAGSDLGGGRGWPGGCVIQPTGRPGCASRVRATRAGRWRCWRLSCAPRVVVPSPPDRAACPSSRWSWTPSRTTSSRSA